VKERVMTYRLVFPPDLAHSLMGRGDRMIVSALIEADTGACCYYLSLGGDRSSPLHT
jgi:hypothetical protein